MADDLAQTLIDRADPPPRACLSVREAARYLRVGAAKVLAWIRAGDLQAADLGRNGKPTFRITPEALADFLAGRSASRPKTKPRRRQPARAQGWVERY